MLNIILMLLLGTASADDASCVRCCQESGLISCPTQVRVFGDGSVASPESGGWRVIGLWWLDCDGTTRFEAGGTVVIDHQPRPGEILRLAYPPDTVDCFGGHCSLPRDACMISHDQGQNFAIRNCETHEPLNAVEMRRQGPSQVVIVRDATNAANDDRSPALNSVREPTNAPPLDTSTIEVDIHLPSSPEADCSTSDLLRAQSRRQQEEGDQARVLGEYQESANHYNAALSMDPCNAFAWHSLGLLAISGGDLDAAIRALRNATELSPTHYGALTSLGEAYERSGSTTLASEAYNRALSIHPQHAPARQGLARIQGSR